MRPRCAVKGVTNRFRQFRPAGNATAIPRAGRMPSDLAAVISPMQQGLPLASPTRQITRFAMLFDLRYVSLNRFPAFDLPRIFFGHAPAHVVAAVPLEPAARIVRMNPSLFSPYRERLASVNAEIIQRAVPARRRDFCARKPARGKFRAAIGHVLAAKYPEGKHLLGR